MRSGPEMRVAWYVTWALTSISMRVRGSPFPVRILVTCGWEPAVGWSPMDASGLEGSEPDDGGAAVTGPLVVRASSIRSSKSVSTRPFDSNTLYPDCAGFGSVYHAVILEVTWTRVSSGPVATTWTVHSK